VAAIRSVALVLRARRPAQARESVEQLPLSGALVRAFQDCALEGADRPHIAFAPLAAAAKGRAAPGRWGPWSTSNGDGKRAERFQKALKGIAYRACFETDDPTDFGARWQRLVLDSPCFGDGSPSMWVRHPSSSIVRDGLTGEIVAVKSIPDESLFAASVVCENVIIKRSCITPIATVRGEILCPPYLDGLLRLAAACSCEIASSLAMQGEGDLDHMQST
jgi:hypothetical protein